MRTSPGNRWGQRLGLASCPLSVLVSTLIFHDAVELPVLIGLVAVATVWLVLELGIGARPASGNRIRNPRWVAVTRGLWLLGPWVCWLDRLYGLTTFELSANVQLVIMGVGVCGLALRIAAIAQVGRAFTYSLEASASLKLRTTGVYGWIRHPSFTGLLILTNLLGVITGSIAGILVLALTIPNVILRIAQEEAELEQRFGADYAHYKLKTSRLIPLIY